MVRHRDWQLQTGMIRLSSKDVLTLEDLFTNILVLGGIGSAKSSTTVRMAATACLKKGMGMLFLCAKADAAATYIDWAKEAGREEDVVVFRPGSQCFNFISYESSVHGEGNQVIENVLDVLVSAYELVARNRGGGSNDAVWEQGRNQMLRNNITIDLTAHRGISLRRLLRIAQTLPQSLADLEEPQKFYSLQVLEKAEKSGNETRKRDIELASDYIRGEMPTMSSRTRASLCMETSVMLDSFQRYPLFDMFSGESTVTPDDILAGKIVIFDVSVKEFLLVGKIAGVIFKRCLQRAIERRMRVSTSDGSEILPIAIVADECHFWSTTSDVEFTTTSRSAKAISIYATQSIPNFLMELGAEGAGKAKVDSLLGNFGVRFYHQNQENQTNLWASESIGKIIVRRTNAGQSASGTSNWNPSGPNSSSSSFSASSGYSEQLDFDLNPRAFTGLMRGGESFGFVAEAIVTALGKRFKHSDERWLRIKFDQFGRVPFWKKSSDEAWVSLKVNRLDFLTILWRELNALWNRI